MGDMEKIVGASAIIYLEDDNRASETAGRVAIIKDELAGILKCRIADRGWGSEDISVDFKVIEIKIAGESSAGISGIIEKIAAVPNVKKVIMDKKVELKVRAAIKYDTGIESVINVAAGTHWGKDGCITPYESYCVSYAMSGTYEGKGKIVEAEYRGGRTEFEPKTDFKTAPLIRIPGLIHKAATTPVFPEGIPDDFKRPENLLMPWHFKPLPKECWDFVRDNCFRLDLSDLSLKKRPRRWTCEKARAKI